MSNSLNWKKNCVLSRLSWNYVGLESTSSIDHEIFQMLFLTFANNYLREKINEFSDLTIIITLVFLWTLFKGGLSDFAWFYLAWGQSIYTMFDDLFSRSQMYQNHKLQFKKQNKQTNQKNHTKSCPLYLKRFMAAACINRSSAVYFVWVVIKWESSKRFFVCDGGRWLDRCEVGIM